ncbi:hypothetical protein BU15DRAFT_59898 [Melanogaster broomeanus]|nr:hypothetical protein BU15DRAFT_59898 [Melanogaster broomeanus]
MIRGIGREVHSKAPGWGARNVKFGAGGTDGRPGHEIMTFTEHTNLLHVIDARTFETEEIIRMPGVIGREASPLASSRATSLSSMLSDPSPISPVPSSLRQVTQPPRTLRAMEEASRVNPFPNGGPLATWRPSRIVLRRDGSDNGGYDYDEVVVIRDNAVEDTREAFPRHGVRARLAHRTDSHSQLPTRGGSGMYVYDGNDLEGEGREDADSMDIDEPETDCISRGPSRSSSPPPSLHLPLQPSPSPSRSTALTRYSNARNSSRPSRRTTARDGVVAEQVVQNSDRDIAGTCFDPHGGFIYVATTDSVSEWAVRGAEKRWWGCNAWV